MIPMVRQKMSDSNILPVKKHFFISMSYCHNGAFCIDQATVYFTVEYYCFAGETTREEEIELTSS